MLFLKKLSYHLIIPPGIFILGFVLGGYQLRGWKRYLMFSFALFLYIFSITPTKDLFLYPLEKDYRITHCNGDIIVILGGGVYGSGELSEDAFKRLLKGFEKADKCKIIIVSGGRINENLPYEADLMKNHLVKLGVDGQKILVDRLSRDTVDNVRFVKQVIENNFFSKGVILITSAYHMKRSLLLFEREGFKNICPEATDFKFDGVYSVYDFLPQTSNLNTVSKALKEYIGLFIYSFR